MAYAHTTDLGHTLQSRFAAIGAEIGLFFQTLAAARRVASAVEHDRQANRDDLAILGITEPLPTRR